VKGLGLDSRWRKNLSNCMAGGFGWRARWAKIQSLRSSCPISLTDFSSSVTRAPRSVLSGPLVKFTLIRLVQSQAKSGPPSRRISVVFGRKVILSFVVAMAFSRIFEADRLRITKDAPGNFLWVKTWDQYTVITPDYNYNLLGG